MQTLKRKTFWKILQSAIAPIILIGGSVSAPCLLASDDLSTPLPTEDLAQPAVEAANERGKFLYVHQCASCHGTNGEGVADKYDETLYGNRSLDELIKIIHETMPEEDPDSVVDEDARAVAEYLYNAFYTAEARAKNAPPRIELVRLTNSQYANTVTDLFRTFLGHTPIDDSRGLVGRYYKSRSPRDKDKVLTRTDPQVSFQFGEGSPAEGIENEEFAMRWEGSVIAEETGVYEFCVKTENGMRLWINGRDNALIDAYVASGGEVAEHRQTIHLLGGRAYSLDLECFKYKDKTASVELRWTPPGGVEEVIPERNLTPVRARESFVVTTQFPPDDGSFGYERGTSFSKSWDSATTEAAIEVADYVVRDLNRLAGTRSSDENRNEKITKFLNRFVELAFRRPLTPELVQRYITSQIDQSDDIETAVKRTVLLTLKSPRFLYLEIPDEQTDDYDVASRLSYGLWDSMPDETLLKAASQGKLRSREQIRKQAERMIADERAREKMRGFFHFLLPFDEADHLSKDLDTYPGFTDDLIADLKTSLEMFIADVVWSEKSDFRELLLSNEMYFTPRMAQFYEVELDPEGGEYQRIAFEPEQRAGVVTHPFLLAALAYHQSSSPIHRGVFVTRRILSRSLKPPPMAIEFMDGSFDPSLTMREKVTELTKSKTCMTCHSTINPLGFSLEHFDAVGRFRTTDKDRPVDATSDFVDADGTKVHLTGARDVAEYAVEDPLAQEGFVEQLFNHSIKQPVRAYGADSLDQLVTDFQNNQYNIQQLLIEINTLAAAHGVDDVEREKP
ncbi:PA14 domain protein [Thalassoglobus neptunius]|uniref:PA14 domain protein n=1 Tax=Thalassoglobus neptunius TaxID=1938619 RepID=A0A5C5WN22_9PLAN|nr:DUF1592 domain-containing protein [Thalassoglobus neptunius]TWT52214.1 PA14 domain protein [Thalassoglobus neptunius]